MLYEDFARSQAKREVEDCLEDQEKGGKKEEATQPTTHIFQVCVCLRVFLLRRVAGNVSIAH